MAATYLCDTNIISELMRPQAHPGVRGWMGAQERIFLSVLTLEELCFGLRRKDLRKKRAWLDRFIASRCELFPIDAAIAVRAGEMRGELAGRGQTRTQADLLIAATAWKHGCILVTRNTRDFEGINVPLFDPFQEEMP